MSQARLQSQSPGEFSLTGDLSFETVPGLVASGRQLFSGADEVRLNLAGVGRSDSAGLALLVSWLRLARQQGKQLSLQEIPQQLIGLARVSGVEHILAVD